jgi:hypothetical protein
VLGADADRLEAAAWLHDIGYAPDLVDTGFHPLDGARYLRDTHNADTHLCNLVAHHSCALLEAQGRRLARDLCREFGIQPPHLSNYLIYCDMTTSPTGEQVPVADRLSEILARYGRGHVVADAITKASPQLIRAVHGTQSELLSIAGTSH